MKYEKNKYEIIEFRRSTCKHKKYDVFLINKQTRKIYKLSFGDKRYEQFKDSTGLGLYSKLNHGDKRRRSLYRKRHRNTYDPKYYSPAYFSWRYLW